MWLIDFVKGFFKPTKSRIFLFFFVFILISLYDISFRPFPNSPVIYNPFGKASLSFVIYFLIMPYILSCIIPSVLELRKRKVVRHAKLWEFLRQTPANTGGTAAQNVKPATKIQSTYIIEGFGHSKEDIMEMEMENLEQVVESSAEAPKQEQEEQEMSYVEKIEQENAARSKPQKTKPASKTRAAKTRTKTKKKQSKAKPKAKKPTPKQKRK